MHSHIFPTQPPVPEKPRRSKPKLIIGIILVVLGGLALLSRMASAVNGRSEPVANAAEALGGLIGALILIIVPIVIGIILIVKSKPKA